VTVRSEHARGEDPAVLARAARRRVSGPVEAAESLRAALRRARTLAGDDGVVCVAGSLYLAGDLLKNRGALRSVLERKAPRAVRS